MNDSCSELIEESVFLKIRGEPASAHSKADIVHIDRGKATLIEAKLRSTSSSPLIIVGTSITRPKKISEMLEKDKKARIALHINPDDFEDDE